MILYPNANRRFLLSERSETSIASLEAGGQPNEQRLSLHLMVPGIFSVIVVAEPAEGNQDSFSKFDIPGSPFEIEATYPPPPSAPPPLAPPQTPSLPPITAPPTSGNSSAANETEGTPRPPSLSALPVFTGPASTTQPGTAREANLPDVPAPTTQEENTSMFIIIGAIGGFVVLAIPMAIFLHQLYFRPKKSAAFQRMENSKASTKAIMDNEAFEHAVDMGDQSETHDKDDKSKPPQAIRQTPTSNLETRRKIGTKVPTALGIGINSSDTMAQQAGSARLSQGLSASSQRSSPLVGGHDENELDEPRESYDKHSGLNPASFKGSPDQISASDEDQDLIARRAAKLARLSPADAANELRTIPADEAARVLAAMPAAPQGRVAATMSGAEREVLFRSMSERERRAAVVATKAAQDAVKLSRASPAQRAKVRTKVCAGGGCPSSLSILRRRSHGQRCVSASFRSDVPDVRHRVFKLA